MVMQPCILALNCGSSSLKFALYEGMVCVGRGTLTKSNGVFHAWVQGNLLEDFSPPIFPADCVTMSGALHNLMQWFERHLPKNALHAIGHRVVHGGHLTQAARLTSDILAYLEGLVPMAPLHQPLSLRAIHLIGHLYPDVPQVGCFDTAFHAGIPALHRRFAIPRDWHDKGVKRYGFHGLSYEYIATKLCQCAPDIAQGRVIVAHLGSGASLCALKGGRSFETSMGFSTLDGLMMGTRCGTLDPGVILYMLKNIGMDAAALEHMLYQTSGLLGVSAISADISVLLASQEIAACEAVDLFCYRAIREIGAMISVLGGLDAIVFTGGIGEHAPAIRAKIARDLQWIGLQIDAKANESRNSGNAVHISALDSQVDAWVIPTDEESVITKQTIAALPKIAKHQIDKSV